MNPPSEINLYACQDGVSTSDADQRRVDVIEHVPQVHRFMERVSALMAPHALLVVETGCADSPTARLLGRNWYYPSLFDHARAFGRRSISLLLSKCGLCVESIEIKSRNLRYWMRIAPRSTLLLILNLAGINRRLRGALGAPHLPIRDHMLVYARRQC